MALILYQVGDLPIFNVIQDDSAPSEYDSERAWRVPQTTFTGSGGSVNHLQTGRPLLSPSRMTVTGGIIPGAPLSASTFMGRLMALGGRNNTPIIAFWHDEQDSDGNCCDGCMSFDWYLSYGTVSRVGRKQKVGDVQDQHSLARAGVDFEIAFGSRWAKLTPWFWEYRNPNARLINPASENNVQSLVDNFFTHPKSIAQITNGATFFKWNDVLSRYNPTYWGIKYARDANGIGSGLIAPCQVDVYSSPDRWSANPLSVYAFTNLKSTGTLRIIVKSTPSWYGAGSQEEISELDLSTLNADLAAAGFIGLLETDLVVAGYADPLPGFVVRDEVVLEVRPRWEYPGSYPGETYVGYSRVQAVGENTTVRWAFLHEFGVL